MTFDLDDLEYKAKAAGGGQWSVQWFECKADSDDVRHAATKPLEKGEKRELLSVGDVLWRVPHQIGPISPDHCHWAGNHLACSEEEAEFAASANPATMLALTARIRELEELIDEICEYRNTVARFEPDTQEKLDAYERGRSTSQRCS
jgi:hypothetical protein